MKLSETHELKVILYYVLHYPPLALGFVFLVEENFFITSSCTEVYFLVEEKVSWVFKCTHEFKTKQLKIGTSLQIFTS